MAKLDNIAIANAERSQQDAHFAHSSPRLCIGHSRVSNTLERLPRAFWIRRYCSSAYRLIRMLLSRKASTSCCATTPNICCSKVCVKLHLCMAAQSGNVGDLKEKQTQLNNLNIGGVYYSLRHYTHSYHLTGKSGTTGKLEASQLNQTKLRLLRSVGQPNQLLTEVPQLLSLHAVLNLFRNIIFERL